MKVNALSIPVAHADIADLEYVREFVQKYAGFDEGTKVDGPTDETIMYFAMLRFVEAVRVLEARGTDEDKRSLAREFFTEEESENNEEEDEEFPSDPDDPDDRRCPSCGEWLYVGCECNDEEDK